MRKTMLRALAAASFLTTACGSGDAATNATTASSTAGSSTTATSSGSGGAGTTGSGGATGTSTGTQTGAGGQAAGGAAAGGSKGTGTVTGTKGGELDLLSFAVVGDTRPPIPNDTPGYPTKIITKIWADIQAASPRPALAIGTGDYASSVDLLSQAAAQVDLYMTARAAFEGPFFPAMGNHECTVATTANCGPGTKKGLTKNYENFVSKMLAPIGVTTPYYTVEIASLHSAWTAKLVVVAPNAWTDAQATWLGDELARPTTYTFVVRHEHTSATAAPGTQPSQDIILQHPFTLLVSGHTHKYAHNVPEREIIVGNGGAPLTGGGNYGYVIVRQQPNGDILVASYDYETNAAIDQFALHADGSPAP